MAEVSRVGLTNPQIMSVYEIHEAHWPLSEPDPQYKGFFVSTKMHLKQRTLCISWPAVPF